MSPTTRRLTMALLFLASAGFVRLGIWQLSRLHQRRAANIATIAARSAPPVSIGAGSTGTDTLGEHYVVAEGRYDHAHEILLRGEVLEGAPGVELVTPLLLAEGGPAVLVNRGFLPAPDAVSAVTDGTEEPGAQRVRGLALPLGSAPGEPVEHGGRTTWRRLDIDALRQRLPYAVLPIYILQTPDSSLPRFPRRIAPPPVDEGPHLSYAIQWFLFAGLAVGFAVLVVGGKAGG
ncbi:MAG TPA: SURF1 family protein, partial [Gemmatimonadales bacterium]|nr:SURF1 family protein [Gemmatimonadales bacterium]